MPLHNRIHAAIAVALLAACAHAQNVRGAKASGNAFSVTATAKGPNQINLRWSTASSPGYGYLVYARSGDDARYTNWTELRPTPQASGYTCDPAVVWHGGVAGCTISDPTGALVYNPAINGVPTWVTEAHYVDPQDGTPAQFIVTGLRNGARYDFKVRTYAGSTAPTYGAFSAIVTATTARYPVRYISTTGNDGNDGLTPATAWRGMYKAGGVDCGTLVLAGGGDYGNESFGLGQNCPPTAKVVLQANYGEKPRITTNAHPDWGSVLSIWGSGIVLDGLTIAENYQSDYVLSVNGNRNALFNMDVGPTIIPSGYGGVSVHGNGNLIYGNYIHDFGSPSNAQNGSGNGGFLMVVDGGATANVVWSNHLTRGSHDCTLVRLGIGNRFLNNIADGGWGMAFETIYGAEGNLFEGLIGLYAGALEANIYKPALEASFANNTLRRSIFAHAGKAIEVNAYWTAVNNLIYNNVFYNVSRCYFQSADAGVEAYDGVKLQNNICVYTDDVSEIYLNNLTPDAISHNSFWKAGGNGTDAGVAWYWNALGGLHVTLAQAEIDYAPAFTHNAALSKTAPVFVNPAAMDFHLDPRSPLRGAGMRIADPHWAAPSSIVPDLGAHGLTR